MANLVSWIKKNKLVLLLILLVVWFYYKDRYPRPFPLALSSVSKNAGGFAESAPSMGIAMDTAVSRQAYMAEDVIIDPPYQPEVPPTDSDERLVIQDTNLSMVVDEVNSSISSIEQIATQNGGFLVNSNQHQPEGAASGSITIRVKSDQRLQALEAIKNLGVRVVSENVNGRDVTDQYADIESRLEVLYKTKTKFETILDQANEVSDLLQVQRELVNLQSQIDNLVGRQQYLQKSADLTKITIYLSTDELALPYTPDEVWRPQVVFKQAVRSLVQTFRSGVNSIIWLGVYSIILVPVALVLLVIYKLLNKK